MARSRNYRRRSGSRRPARKFIWAEVHGSMQTGTEGSEATPNYVNLTAAFENAYGAQLIGATVVTIRGFIAPTSFGSSEPADQAIWAAGALVTSDSILHSGDTPENRDRALDYAPFNNPHDDWMLWVSGRLPSDVAAAQVATSNVGGSEYGIYNRSSRKIEELGQGLYLFPDASTYDGAQRPLVYFNYELRIGLKLP